MPFGVPIGFLRSDEYLFLNPYIRLHSSASAAALESIAVKRIT